MDTNQLINDFAKFAEYAKENGLLADCFYD